jgi:CRISPR-associated protein Cas1
MSINAVGLEPAVGFLHDFSDYQTKESIAYDLQEPFWWLVDLSVIQAFESKILELHDLPESCIAGQFRLSRRDVTPRKSSEEIISYSRF